MFQTRIENPSRFSSACLIYALVAYWPWCKKKCNSTRMYAESFMYSLWWQNLRHSAPSGPTRREHNTSASHQSQIPSQAAGGPAVGSGSISELSFRTITGSPSKDTSTSACCRTPSKPWPFKALVCHQSVWLSAPTCLGSHPRPSASNAPFNLPSTENTSLLHCTYT